MGRSPFGSGAQLPNSAWHRLHPGEAVSDGSDGGSGSTERPADEKHGRVVDVQDNGDGTETLIYEDGHKVAQHKDRMTPQSELEGSYAPHSVWVDINQVSTAGALLGIVAGAAVAGLGGAAVGGGIGLAAGTVAGATRHWRFHRPADDDSGAGPAGPRARYAHPAFRPADDGTGPTGPWSHAGAGARRARRQGFRDDLMPAPDDPGGGGPWSAVYKPNPDTADPGNPHSRARVALADLVSATSALATRSSR